MYSNAHNEEDEISLKQYAPLAFYRKRNNQGLQSEIDAVSVHPNPFPKPVRVSTPTRDNFELAPRKYVAGPVKLKFSMENLFQWVSIYRISVALYILNLLVSLLIHYCEFFSVRDRHINWIVSLVSDYRFRFELGLIGRKYAILDQTYFIEKVLIIFISLISLMGKYGVLYPLFILPGMYFSLPSLNLLISLIKFRQIMAKPPNQNLRTLQVKRLTQTLLMDEEKLSDLEDDILTLAPSVRPMDIPTEKVMRDFQEKVSLRNPEYRNFEPESMSSEVADQTYQNIELSPPSFKVTSSTWTAFDNENERKQPLSKNWTDCDNENGGKQSPSHWKVGDYNENEVKLDPSPTAMKDLSTSSTPVISSENEASLGPIPKKISLWKRGFSIVGTVIFFVPIIWNLVGIINQLVYGNEL